MDGCVVEKLSDDMSRVSRVVKSTERVATSAQNDAYVANKMANAAYTLASSINSSLASKITTGEVLGHTVECEVDPELAFYLYPAVKKAYEKGVKQKKAIAEKARQEHNKIMDKKIRDVQFNDNWTIIKWADGDVTRVYCSDMDMRSPAGGFNAAVAKYYFGSAYNKIMHKWCDDQEQEDWDERLNSAYEEGYYAGERDAENRMAKEIVDESE